MRALGWWAQDHCVIGLNLGFNRWKELSREGECGSIPYCFFGGEITLASLLFAFVFYAFRNRLSSACAWMHVEIIMVLCCKFRCTTTRVRYEPFERAPEEWAFKIYINIKMQQNKNT